MENQFLQIHEAAMKIAAYNTNTLSELKEILKTNGGKYFRIVGNMLFTVNEHEILEGIGYDWVGNFKIWDNSKFGSFKVKDDENKYDA